MSPPSFDPALDATIDSSPRAPAEARRALEDLARRVEPGVLRDAQLLVSEVVTNSVRHSGCEDPIELRVWLRRRGVKVEIADGGFGFEADERAAGDDAEGGRGLIIVQALADRWGVNRDSRTRVWFELSPGSASHAQAS